MKLILPIKDRPSPQVLEQAISNLKAIHNSRKDLSLSFLTSSKKSKKLLKSFNKPDLSFRLRGRTAGIANLQLNLLKLNAVLTNNQKYTKHMLTEILAHEYGHLLLYHISSYLGIRFSSHGKEWREIVHLLGFHPSTYHSMDIIPGRKTILYKGKCRCSKHNLSKKEADLAQRKLLVCNFCKKKVKLN